jgi:tetratricopeptide (TPR) repeat protein
VKNSFRVPSSCIDFVAARSFLLQMGYVPSSAAEALAWRILDPHSPNKTLGALSLTDQMNYDNQIRFFLAERIDRMLGNIANKVPMFLSELEILHDGSLDEGSSRFFQLVSNHIPVVIRHESNPKSSIPALNVVEEIINSLLTSHELLADPAFYLEQARSYLNIGNGWTSEKLLKKLYSFYPNIETAQLLAFALNMQGKPLEAEAFYQAWMQSDRPEDKVRAAYVLSMLYARHHDSTLRSHEKAKSYLIFAHEILKQHSSSSYFDYEFDLVFNRNGYALILFREGKMYEAEALLAWGIEKMKKQDSPKERMHLSVLFFNISQIYEQLQEWEKCLNAIESLISIDPNFSEYHAEFARLLIKARRNFTGAAREIQTALNLDPSAFDSEILYEILYEFSENGHYNEVIDLVSAARQVKIKLNCNVKTLETEALINLERFDEALESAKKLSNPAEALAAIQTMRDHEKLPVAV